MQVSYVDSQGLPKGFRIRQYEDAEILKAVQDPKVVPTITDIINKYLRQKDALVDGRADLCHLLETKTSFPREMESVTVDGKEVKSPKLTEGKHIAAFIVAAMKGQVKEVPVDMKANDEQREAAVYAFLQTLADQCGDTDEKGTTILRDENGFLTAPGFAYQLDLSRPERKPSKPKTPPKYAIEGATNIIANGNAKAWAEKLAKGFKAKTGEVIAPIVFQPFETVAPAGATPEQTEAVKQTNINNLAFAIVEVEDQKRAQRAKVEYA